VGSEEVDDGVGSQETFGGKFWQPQGMSESLWGLRLVKAAQWFIYWGTTLATGMDDVSGPATTEDHSSDRWLTPSACCYCDPYIYIVSFSSHMHK
jgi:hypothetical protein